MVEAAAKTEFAYLPGFTLKEYESLAGVPHKDGYRLVKLGRVEAYRDSEGQLRISPFEAYRYVKNREQQD
jgi:hypothetical protein